MKSATVDEAGEVRCPYCGAKAFERKRTTKGKLSAGLLAPKRPKCLACGKSFRVEPPKGEKKDPFGPFKIM